MALSKLSVKSLGVVACLGIASVASFAVISPINASAKDNSSQLETARTTTLAKETKLAQLQAGAVNFEQAKKDVEAFLKMTSSTQDVERASRSVSKAVSSGIKIDSFNFGDPEAITPLPNPEASLGGYTSPVIIGGDSSGKASNKGSSNEANAPAGAFQRVPIQVTITASSYLKLADYLDSLGKQERLLNVVSVDSNKGSTDADVKATISGYAFVYAR